MMSTNMNEYEFALDELAHTDYEMINRLAKQLVARMKADHPSVPMSYGAALELIYKYSRKVYWND